MSDWTTDMIGELEDRIVTLEERLIALERKVEQQSGEITRLKEAAAWTAANTPARRQ